MSVSCYKECSGDMFDECFNSAFCPPICFSRAMIFSGRETNLKLQVMLAHLHIAINSGNLKSSV